jgi:hypothetical protein
MNKNTSVLTGNALKIYKKGLRRFRIEQQLKKILINRKSYRNYIYHIIRKILFNIELPSIEAKRNNLFSKKPEISDLSHLGRPYSEIYFYYTKERITLKNINFFYNELIPNLHFWRPFTFFSPKISFHYQTASVKIWDELAKEYKKEWVYCEDREFKTDYEEKAKYVRKKLDLFKKEWGFALNE